MIVWDLVYSFSEPDFLISFSENYHASSNFAECRYYCTFKRPYFRVSTAYSHMVLYAGSPTPVVYADMTLIPSKVKVTGHLNFRKLHFSHSFSSASLPRSSKLMVDRGSMGGLQLVWPRFLKFSPVDDHVTSKFAKC